MNKWRVKIYYIYSIFVESEKNYLRAILISRPSLLRIYAGFKLHIIFKSLFLFSVSQRSNLPWIYFAPTNNAKIGTVFDQPTIETKADELIEMMTREVIINYSSVNYHNIEDLVKLLSLDERVKFLHSFIEYQLFKDSQSFIDNPTSKTSPIFP